MGYIIAYSGSHGTGKTTSAAQKFVDLKMFHQDKSIRFIHDLEALCPYPINKEATQRTQAWLFSNQINQELTSLARFDFVITDRTVVDVIGYTAALGFHDLAMDMIAFAGHHMSLYNTIYFKKIINNEFCHADGIRDAEDQRFRQSVEDLMLVQYEHLIAGRHLPGNIYYV